ncbi:MAG: MFS transporter [Streptosporangiales bacterium]|nr:MFS transporter [Streptosporangiales bacterium]MBO0890060.1 MFS transporter [Acidothermales bacterium]
MTVRASAATGTDLRRARVAAVATAVVFAANGALYGSWVTRIPAVRDHVAADPGALGLALLCLGGASLLSMPTTGALVRRFGSRAVCTVTALLSAVGFTLAGTVPTVWALGIALGFAGLSWGVWDVAMNVQGHDVERRLGRDIMPRYHACWSGGSIVGSAAGAVVASHGILPSWHFGVAGAAMFVGTTLAATRFLPDRTHAATQPAGEHHRPAWRVLDTRLALIGLLCLCGTICEGAASDWLTLLFHDGRGASPGAAAAAFTTYTAAMAAGRFLGTNTIAALGRTRALRLTGLVAAVGIACALVVPTYAGGLVGTALWGLGISIVFPAAMSSAGDAGRRPADAIAAVSTVGYGGFLIGPPLIGFLARAFELRNALWVVAVLAGGIAVLAFTAGQRRYATGGDRHDAGR